MVAIIIHIRYTRTTITMIIYGMDMKVIRFIMMSKQQVLETGIMTRNRKADMLTETIRTKCITAYTC
jgi:hypothetical protein